MKHDWQPIPNAISTYKCTVCKAVHRKLLGRWTKRSSREFLDSDCHGTAPAPVQKRMSEPRDVHSKFRMIDNLPSVEMFGINGRTVAEFTAVLLLQTKCQKVLVRTVGSILHGLGLIKKRDFNKLCAHPVFRNEFGRYLRGQSQVFDVGVWRIEHSIFSTTRDCIDYGFISLRNHATAAELAALEPYKSLPWEAIQKWDDQWGEFHRVANSLERKTGVPNARFEESSRFFDEDTVET